MNYRKISNRKASIVLSTIVLIFLMFSITLNNAQAKFLFKTRIDYNASGFVAIGDMDGDSNLDLAVTYEWSHTVSVLLGNGDGSFQSAVNYNAGDVPNSVAIDDLNGDGNLDLAVAVPGSGVLVLLGNGDGTFQDAVKYEVNGPFSVAIGDLNGDDNLDLVTDGASAAEGVWVLLGNGDGSFQTAAKHSTGVDPQFVAIGDLNGDRGLDIVVVNSGSDTVSVLLGSGDGSFQTAVDYDAGLRPYNVAIGDLNGDGKLDLTVGNDKGDAGRNVSVLLGNGDGSFQTAVNYVAGDGSSSVALGDLDGDGDLDLAVANNRNWEYYDSNTVSVLLGNGDGSFQTAVHYNANCGNVTIGDLNGDGALDLVTDYVSALLGNGDGSFQSAVNYNAGDGPTFVAIEDLNGDGDLDLAVANQADWYNEVPGTVSVLLGNGDGSFQSAMNYGVGDDPRSIAIDDLNGDGNPDLVVENRKFECVWVWLATPLWGGEVCYNLPGAVSVLLGNGDGSFQSAVHYAAGVGPTSVAIDDLNGDGDLDMAVANQGDWYNKVPGTVSVLLGNGDGSFQDAVNYNAGDGPTFVAIEDLNGDGDLDMAVANQKDWADDSPGTVSVLLGNSDGSFQDAVHYAAGDGPAYVAIEDLNGDGDPDLAVANAGGEERNMTVSVLLGNGDGTFQSAVKYIAGDGPSSIAIGDLNGDGSLDLAVANGGDLAGRNVSVLLGNGDGSFQSAVRYGVGSGSGSVAIGYLNNDGDLDLAVANNCDDNVSILINTGPATYMDLLYTPVKPCRIVDTREAGGIIAANTVRNFHVHGNGSTVSAQGGNSAGCPSPMGEPLAALINLVVANPTGGGNMQAFAAGGGPGVNLGVNFADIGSNLANAGIVKTTLGAGPDITVASRISSAHAVIDVLGYYYPDGDLIYTPVKPCRIADTRKAGGIIGSNTQRSFHVHGNGGTISAQGGNIAGCPALMGEPFAVHINMAAVNPTGKGNLQAFAVGDIPGANFGINFAAIGTNFANAGIVETDLGLGPEITVAARYSSVHTVIDVLGYYYQYGDLLYTPVTPCRIVDTRESGGMIGVNTERDFHVFGDSSTISAQGGNSSGCPAPSGEPLAAHINLVVANPTGKGNMQAYPLGGTPGANLGVNFAAIGTNFANAGTVQTATGSGPEITVTSRVSSAHAVIDVLGYYYPAP